MSMSRVTQSDEGPGSQLSLHFVNSLQISNLTFHHKLEFAVIILSLSSTTERHVTIYFTTKK